MERGKLKLVCKDILNGCIEQVAVELNMMIRLMESENYRKNLYFSNPKFLVLNQQTNNWTLSEPTIAPTVEYAIKSFLNQKILI